MIHILIFILIFFVIMMMWEISNIKEKQLRVKLHIKELEGMLDELNKRKR